MKKISIDYYHELLNVEDFISQRMCSIDQRFDFIKSLNYEYVEVEDILGDSFYPMVISSINFF